MRPILIAMLVTGITSPLAAQGWIEVAPNFPGNGVTRVRTAVHVTVNGRVAEVEVEEWFRNDGRILGEGDYIYPLPGEAVFSNFSLFQGDQELQGETMDASQARSIYEEIVRRKRDPALIELVGHGLVRARVFPINPGDTRKITLRYTQVMRRAGDALQFQYAAGSPRVQQIRPSGETTRPAVRPQTEPLSFLLEVEDGAAFRDPFSPTHRMRVDRDNGRLRVRPETTLTGNLSLFLPLARNLVGVTVATHRPSGEPGYFMLTLSPGDADGEIEPRDVTVVVDVSGSMSGEKMRQAQAAIDQLLASLNERDRFRLIAFNNSVTTYRADWSAANRGGIREARRWIADLRPTGGTNIAGALDEAFRIESPAARLPLVLFLTDGLPSVGEQNPDRIASQAEGARGRARVFAFGVGYDVNTYLLDRLTAAGRGATEYVEPQEDVEQALSALALKIQHPVLTDIEIGQTPVRLSEIYPLRLPDLFAGEELIVFGRYEAGRADRNGAIRIEGRRLGRTERFATDAQFAAHELANDFIPRLWASRKLGHLARQIRLEGHSAALEREIRETALRYGLLSEYTSYLVQEPEAFALDTPGPRPRPRPRPRPMTRSAPAAASGAAAVRRSERQRVMREVASEQDMAALEDRMVSAPNDARKRFVAGRWFTLEDGLWTDQNHSDSLAVVEVELYSSDYFDLLGRLPELSTWLTEFENVLVAGDAVSIKIVTDDVSGINLERLVRRFRGH